MGKCLITKLNGKVDDSSILKIGEIRVSVSEVDNANMYTNGLQVVVSKETKAEIVGDGYFTDENFTENNGKTITLTPNIVNFVYFSNGNYEIAIHNKYVLQRLLGYGKPVSGTIAQFNKKIKIEDLAYCANLINMNLYSMAATGDIRSIKGLSKLDYLSLLGTDVDGDIANLKDLTHLTYINLGGTKVYGDIGSLKNLTALNYLSLTSNVNGDIAILSPMLTKLYTVSSSLDWSTRPSTSKIIAIVNDPIIKNIDKMLQDQAQCVVGLVDSDLDSKIIKARGTRTSASDDAVAALQANGYTVSITPA